MKHFMGILIFVAVIFCPAAILGQPTLTVRGGINAATLLTDRGDLNLTASGGNVRFAPGKTRGGVRMGVCAVIPIRDRFSLQFGGDYVSKGARDLSRNLELILDYIEFSGLTVITLPPRTPSLSILIGPVLAFKVKTELEGLVSGSYESNSSDFNALDYGIAVGIGTQMAISEAMAVKAELLYTWGIRPINKISESADMTNRVISFTIGLGFPYGKTGG